MTETPRRLPAQIGNIKPKPAAFSSVVVSPGLGSSKKRAEVKPVAVGYATRSGDRPETAYNVALKEPLPLKNSVAHIQALRERVAPHRKRVQARTRRQARGGARRQARQGASGR